VETSSLRFAPVSAYPEYVSLLYFYNMFSDLGASTFSNSRGAVYSGTSRVSKITTYGPTRYQVLIPLDIPTVEVIVANIGSVIESCDRSLAKSVHKA